MLNLENAEAGKRPRPGSRGESSGPAGAFFFSFSPCPIGGESLTPLMRNPLAPNDHPLTPGGHSFTSGGYGNSSGGYTSSDHTNPSSDDELEFVDISIEQFREYELANGGTYRIDDPVALFVREESGNHRVLSRREDGQYVSHHVPGDGRRPVRWVVEPGESFFLGWGPEAAKSTPAPAVQPGGGITVQPDSPSVTSVSYSDEVSGGEVGSIELQYRAEDEADTGTYTPAAFSHTLRDRLEQIGGEGLIITTSQGFIVAEDQP